MNFRQKAAAVLAAVIAVQVPVALFGGLSASLPAEITFSAEETAAKEESVSSTMQQYFTAAHPLDVDTEEEEETKENVPEDKGIAASVKIDTSKPVLQAASGTVIMGYYAPSKYTLNDTERDLVERVIMSEVSGKSYVDALAVAQAIYDRSVDWGRSVTSIINQPNQFAGPTKKYTPTALVKQAVSDVFDKGYKLTEEHLYYYYATRTASPLCFHETQRCLVETKLHRYFGPWKQ